MRSGEKVAHPSSPDLGIGHYTTITFPGLVYPSLPLDLRSGGGGGGGGVYWFGDWSHNKRKTNS